MDELLERGNVAEGISVKMQEANKLFFGMSGFDIQQAPKYAAQAFKSAKASTSREFLEIINSPDSLSKTTFYRNLVDVTKEVLNQIK